MTFEHAVWIGLGLKVDKENIVTMPKSCPHCLGAGELEIAPERCPKLAYMRCLTCNGRGELYADSLDWRTSDTPEAEAERRQFEQVMRDGDLMEDDPEEMARED